MIFITYCVKNVVHSHKILHNAFYDQELTYSSMYIYFIDPQIEGAFIQGYGLFVLEDYRVTPSGHLLTKGPGFYKIPAFGDIPGEFNVSLLTRAPNPFAVCSSKVSLFSPS